MTKEFLNDFENKIFWLTGQSGAGKTTIAKRLKKDYDCIVLDGDEMRDSVSLGAGFSREARTEHNYRVARLAKILSKQKTVIVTVIAPMDEVRKEIENICDPIWVYIKKTMPEREGHFYEEPEGCFTLDHDKLSIEESISELKKFMGISDKNIYSLLIGRYQCLPPHEGHLTLARTLLSEGKNVCIALRDTPIRESDPFSVEERKSAFEKIFEKEIEEGKVCIIGMPDIEDVCYGRKVGWGIREIKLDEKIEAISATKAREEMKKEGKL